MKPPPTAPANTPDPSELLALDNQLCFALYSASLAMTKTYKPLLDKLGLTYPQYLVMLVLWERDDMLVKEIGERLFLDSGTLTPLLKRLQGAALIVRTRDQADERQVRITLSAKGKALRQQARDIPLQVLCASGQSPAALRDLRRQLSRVRNQLVQNQD
ncbi:MAG TPA: MarR family transcriptional regulator [Burkholderiaceae bacterium]|nr:MarR family transcriptional regulator [Burkholderiaceae bacterium]